MALLFPPQRKGGTEKADSLLKVIQFANGKAKLDENLRCQSLCSGFSSVKRVKVTCRAKVREKEDKATVLMVFES